MLYNEELYLMAFLLGVLIIYQLVPKKIRWVVLLTASYIFFISYKGWMVLYLVGTTLFTYLIAVWIKYLQNKCLKKIEESADKNSKEIKKVYKEKTKKILILGIVGLIASLLYVHYLEFIIKNTDIIFKKIGSDFSLKNVITPLQKNLIPIGISFYTLEAIGYIADVYWEKVGVEKHPFKLALFLSFFPQLMEGPIALYSQTADQLWEGKSLKIENIKKGYIRIFWGLLKLNLISTRLSPVVKYLFANYSKYSGATIIFAAVAYTTYLYMNFSGSIDIFIGSAKLFGIDLPENFRQPFSSKSASEFWQRWHISLGVWFKTYIFYPVSVSKKVKKWNKFAKKKFSKYIAKVGVSAICLFPVWMCNGLWHGPQWSFIFYGVYYFVILLLEVALEPVRKSILKITKLNEKGFVWRTFLTVKTLIIVFTGELFFNAKSFLDGIKMFLSIFRDFGLSKMWNGNFMTRFGTSNLVIEKSEYLSIIFGIIIVAIFGALKERKNIGLDKIDTLKTPYKWALYYALILIVLFLGAYGIGYEQVDLIYANF